jgi:hypothetical protein
MEALGRKKWKTGMGIQWLERIGAAAGHQWVAQGISGCDVTSSKTSHHDHGEELSDACLIKMVTWCRLEQ